MGGGAFDSVFCVRFWVCCSFLFLLWRVKVAMGEFEAACRMHEY